MLKRIVSYTNQIINMKTPNFIYALFILISCLIFVIFNYFGVLEEVSKFSYLI